VNHFSTHFLGPVEEEYAEEIEEDELGYYADGVKRTLTDSQIAIFRHSEIQALLRDRRRAEEARPSSFEGHNDKERFEEGELGDNNVLEVATPPPLENEQKLSRKARKAQQAKQKGFFKQKIKPDLRKRTWDKVDSGMESLDYDEQSSGALATNQPSQRRKISYDDYEG
jgi:hypothetical protein